MQSAALSLPQGFRDAAKHSKAELSNPNRSSYPTIHVCTPSSPSTDRVEDVDEAIGKTPRKSVDKNTARTSLREVFRQHVTDPAKIVAQKVGASPDSVESYRSGNIPQSWAQMIAFCRAYPAFGLEVLELMGLDIDRDREAYGIFLTLQKRVRGE